MQVIFPVYDFLEIRQFIDVFIPYIHELRNIREVYLSVIPSDLIEFRVGNSGIINACEYTIYLVLPFALFVLHTLVGASRFEDVLP